MTPTPMNRRGFIHSILAAGIAPYVCTAAGVLMPVRNLLVEMPPIRYFYISEIDADELPRSLTDKVDYLPCKGYVGGKIQVRGKEYGALYSYTEKSYKSLGRSEIERQMRVLVDERLRMTFEMIA